MMNKFYDFLILNIGWIIAVISFFIPPIRDFVIKRIQLSLDKARDNNNAINEKKVYISKVRFDKEFEIYQELSETQIDAVYSAGEAVIAARGLYDDKLNDYKLFLEEFCSKINKADITLKKYAPFIDNEIFDNYKELDKKIFNIFRLSKYIICLEEHKCEVVNYFEENKNYNRKSLTNEIEKEQKELSVLSDNIINLMRLYLSSLDVI